MSNETNRLYEDRSQRLAEYLANQMGAAERRTFEEEILGDPELAEMLYAEVSLEAALQEASAAPAELSAQRRSAPVPRRSQRNRSWWAGGWMRFALPLATVVAIVLVAPRLRQEIIPGLGKPPSPGLATPRRLRSGTQRSTPPAVIRGLTPSGQLSESPAAFVWTRHPSATSYRLEVFDSRGARIDSAVTSDTTFRPAGGPLFGNSVAAGSWRVTPLTAAGEGEPSVPTPFRITGR